MKYMETKDISRIPKNVDIWGCAYDEDNNHKYSHLKQKPIKGRIIDNNLEFNIFTPSIFLVYGKKGQLLKSSAVNAYSRCYADTYEECVEVYNSLIDNRIKDLQNMIKESEKSKIKIEEDL